VEYLRKRLADFHDPGSQDPHAIEAMWGVIQQVDDQTLSDMADYYARQPTTSAKSGRPLAEAGHWLYVTGDQAHYIPACDSCHGARGEGHADVPRLAGQHPLYLQNQLERMRLDLRASAVMHPKTNGMTDEQIKELVAYLAGS
jgi:cytochrome c553